MRLKMISAMAAALLLAACASDEAATTGDANASGGSGTTNGITQTVTPGSPQDFQQNVGDRVFFDTDRYDLSAEAQSQLQKQAAWLHRHHFHSQPALRATTRPPRQARRGRIRFECLTCVFPWLRCNVRPAPRKE